jgi:hypothetical protein
MDNARRSGLVAVVLLARGWTTWASKTRRHGVAADERTPADHECTDDGRGLAIG